MPGYIPRLSGLSDVTIPSPATGSIPSFSGGVYKDSIRTWGIGATSTVGWMLENTTLAAAGAQQRSPGMELAGQGWKSNATAASQRVAIRQDVLPVEGAAAPTAALHWLYSVNNGAYSSIANLTSIGDLSVTSLTASSGSPGLTFASARVTAGQGDRTTGLGSTFYYRTTTSDVPLLFINAGLTDGAGKRAFASVWNADAASVDEDAIIHSFGWTNNSDAYQEQITIKPNSVLRFISGWATAAAPTGQEGDLAYVTDGDTGSKCLAFFDGSNWLRISLGAAIAAS